MLSFLLTLAIASVATNPDMKTNFVNYTTPESGRIMDLSGVTLKEDNARILEDKSIERDKVEEKAKEIRDKKLFQECQGRKVCNITEHSPQTDEVVLKIAAPTSASSNITNMTGKVIIETQIQASHKNSNMPERTKDERITSGNLITSSGNPVGGDKKFNLNVTEERGISTDEMVEADQHKFIRSNDISGALKEVEAKNMKSIPTTQERRFWKTYATTTAPIVTAETLTVTKRLSQLTSNSTRTPEKSTKERKSTQIATFPVSDKQSELFSQAFTATTYNYTTPLRSDDSSESNMLSGKNLSDTGDFSGSSLRPTWETARSRTVVYYNSVGKTHNFTTVSATTPLSERDPAESASQVTKKPKTYGVLKYGNETRRRSSGTIGDLKSHMEATYRTFFNFITTETSRDLETYLVDVVTGTRSVFDDVALVNSSDSVSRVIQQEIPWPVKKEAIVEGDLVLGGLMMVHEREDTITCGPVMPQGGIQALEAMLYTLDRLNFGPEALLPNITLGAHILDDCDKDTYGLEMAVDFIKGYGRYRLTNRSRD